MPKYIPRSEIIEATQWFKHGDHPKVNESRFDDTFGYLEEAHESERCIRPGDYIIKGKDEYCRCRPWVFEKIYEETEVDERLQRLEAIESKIQEYDYHSTLASIDQSDRTIHSIYHSDAEEELLLAKDALDEAILMSRGLNRENND